MSFRLSLVVALAAAVLAVLLLGGTATRAAWTDSTGSESTTLTAGNLTAEITQSGPTSVPLGEARGIYPQQGSEGLIPGVQGQQWNYVLSNAPSSAVAADAALRLQGTPQNADEYEALRPFLQASVEVEGQPDPITVPAESFANTGFTYDVDLGARLEPGEDLQVTVTFSVPASVDGSPNLGATLNNMRSTSTTAQPIFTMANAVYLRQASDPS